MSEWGAIVKVNHRIAGKVPWRVLDELMEELSEYAAIASCKEQAISLRLFVTATDRAGAMDRALMIVLAPNTEASDQLRRTLAQMGAHQYRYVVPSFD